MRRYPLITRDTEVPPMFEPGRWRCLSEILFVNTKSLRYARKHESYGRYIGDKTQRPKVPVLTLADRKELGDL
jgi:hypothetical protein